MNHCPRCDSTNVRMGLDVLSCADCGWMNYKMIMARTGPELNKLVATKVMGWVEVNPRDSAAFWRPDNSFSTTNEYMAGLNWSPSTDMTAMGNVVKQMKDDGYQLELRTYMDTSTNESTVQPGVTTGCRFLAFGDTLTKWALQRLWFPGDDEESGNADSIPLAVCRAALIAVNVIPVDKADLQSTGT